MGYLVVTDQADLEGLATSILKARVTKAVRATAVQSILAANPGVDFAALQPGAVIRVPVLEGAKASGGTDGLVADLDQLLATADDAVARLTADSTAAGEANDQERKDIRRLLGARAVGPLVQQLPELRETVDQVLRALEQDSAQERDQTTQLVADADSWKTQLEKLRSLTGS